MTTETRRHPPTAHRIHERLLAAAPLTERRLELAGVTTAIYEGGEGPPMVPLHGQGEYWAVRLNVLDALVDTHPVIVVDLPGHGWPLHVIEECRDDPAAEQPAAFLAALHAALGSHDQQAEA